MIPSQIEVQINKDEIRKYIREYLYLDQQIGNEIIFIDINRLVEITSCSRK